MDKSLGMGWSAISKSEFPASRGSAWRRALLFLVVLIVIGFVFSYITGAIPTGSDVQWDTSSE